MVDDLTVLDLVGKRVGAWTVIGFSEVRKNQRFWRCRCVCGYERDFSTSYLNTGQPSRCPNCRQSLQGEDEGRLLNRYIGRQVGSFTIISLDGANKYGSRRWRCRCACGVERVFPTAYLSGNSKRTATKCTRCILTSLEQANRLVSEIPDRFWRRVLDHAARREIAVKISREEAQELFLKQGGRCAMTGEELHFTKLKAHFNRYTTASLDRIDSTLPYVSGNVQWVHKAINMMKGTLSVAAFVEWCRRVAKH